MKREMALEKRRNFVALLSERINRIPAEVEAQIRHTRQNIDDQLASIRTNRSRIQDTEIAMEKYLKEIPDSIEYREELKKLMTIQLVEGFDMTASTFTFHTGVVEAAYEKVIRVLGKYSITIDFNKIDRGIECRSALRFHNLGRPPEEIQHPYGDAGGGVCFGSTVDNDLRKLLRARHLYPALLTIIAFMQVLKPRGLHRDPSDWPRKVVPEVQKLIQKDLTAFHPALAACPGGV